MKTVNKTPLHDPLQAPLQAPLQNNESALFRDIQAEVTQETQPVLQFITKNVKYIVSVIVLLIGALAVTGGYRWYQKSQQDDMQAKLARIEQRQPDAEQIKALEALAAESAERLRPAVWITLAKSALIQGNFDKACEAYANVARTCQDSSLGFAATLGQASMLMKQEKYEDGVKLLESALVRLPAGAGDQVKVMLAEGAVRAGRYDLAQTTYAALASASQGIQAEYYRARAAEIKALGGGK